MEMGSASTVQAYVVLIALIALTIYVSYMVFMHGANMFTTNKVDEDEQVRRVQQRGTVSALLVSIGIGVLAVVMEMYKVAPIHIEVSMGYLFAPVIGYLVDNAFATDKGLSLFKSDVNTWIKYVFKTLVQWRFIRFVVIFMLDMFISKPLAAILRGYTRVAPETIKGPLEAMVAKNMIPIVTAIVAVLTYQVYANQTRFRWAYPDKSLSPDKMITSTTVFLATSISAVMYMYMYREDLTNKWLNMSMVLGTLLLMSWLGQSGHDDPTADVDDDDTKDMGTDWIIGLVVFILIFILGVAYPLVYGRLGVGGSPDTYVDPILKSIDAAGNVQTR